MRHTRTRSGLLGAGALTVALVATGVGSAQAAPAPAPLPVADCSITSVAIDHVYRGTQFVRVTAEVRRPGTFRISGTSEGDVVGYLGTDGVYLDQVYVRPGAFALTASCPGSQASTTGTRLEPDGFGFDPFRPTAVCRFEDVTVRFTPKSTVFDVTAYVERQGLGGFATTGFRPSPGSADKVDDGFSLYVAASNDGLGHTSHELVGTPPSNQQLSAFFTCDGDQYRLDYRTPSRGTSTLTLAQELARLATEVGPGQIRTDALTVAIAHRAGDRDAAARALALVSTRARSLPAARTALVQQHVLRIRHLLGVRLPAVHVVLRGEHLWQVVRDEQTRRRRPHDDHAVALGARLVQRVNRIGTALTPGQLLVLPPGL